MTLRICAAVIACALALSISAAEAKHRHRPAKSVSLSGIVSSELLDKTREIMSACGAIVVSARSRRSYRSNHPIGRAVDLQGNPRCIYAHLKGWPGGYSTDYASAPGGKHVHISYNPHGQEWGLRFAHNHARHRHPNVIAAGNVAGGDRWTPQ